MATKSRTQGAHILDSSAWIECLDAGANTEHFAPILHKLPDLIVPAITITEVRKLVLRQRSQAMADDVTSAMSAGQVVAIDAGIAAAAADLAIKHKLPLADSLIYAVTLAHHATLWTQDDDFEGLPHVRYFKKVKTR